MDAQDRIGAPQHIFLLDGFEADKTASRPPVWLQWMLLTLAAVFFTAMVGLFITGSFYEPQAIDHQSAELVDATN